MKPPVAAVVLAAGRGTRFQASGGTAPSKLVATFGSKALVRHVVEAALGSLAAPVIVVTGHARHDVEAVLAGLPVQLAHNADYAEGLASSLKTGVRATPSERIGAVILLGDMPMVSTALIDRMLAEIAAEPDTDAVVPVAQGRRGNPVYLSRTLFPAIERLEGDAGARQLLRGDEVRVREFALDDPATTVDVDEATDLTRLSARADEAEQPTRR